MKVPMLKITVEALVPVDAKDAIQQAVVTHAMQESAKAIVAAAEERGGRGTIKAQIIKVEVPEPQLPSLEPTVDA